MWFDELMDNFKETLIISRKHKGIFIPIFLKLALSIGFFIYMVVSFIAVFGVAAISFDNGLSDAAQLLTFLAPLTAVLIIAYFLVVIFNALMEAGTLNLYKAAITDTKPTMSLFLEGIKSFFFRIIGGTLLIHLVTLLLSPIILVLYLLFTFTAGILSGGWGMVFLSIAIAVYFAAWTSIAVLDDIPAVKAIGTGFRLARRRFKTFFLINLALTLLVNYGIVAFGLPITIIAGWFIAGVITAYFRVSIMLMYKKYSEEAV